MIDNLNLKQYLPQVYEDWTSTMLRSSGLEEHKLKERIKTKFDGLRDKMGSASISANIFIANSDICVSEYVLDDINKDIDLPSNVDFTKLANIAF